MAPAGADEADPDELADLPELDVDDTEEHPDEHGGFDLSLPEPDGDADDEDSADDIPVELGLTDTQGEPTDLDDDSTGIADTPVTLGLSLEERSESLIGSDSELGCGDDTLGIRDFPDTDDRTDADGLDDPDGDQVDSCELPPLDAGEEGDDEIDVGLDITEPPAEPSDDGPESDDMETAPR